MYDGNIRAVYLLNTGEYLKDKTFRSL